MKCINCGKDSVEQTCIPCEIEIRAQQPPQVLVDLRYIYEGGEAKTGPQRTLAGLKAQNPREFLIQLRGAEKDWRLAIAALKAREGPAPAAEAATDERTERLTELIDRLLKEIP